ATPRDLGHLRASLASLPAVCTAAGETHGAPSVPDCQEIHDLLATALTDDPPALIGKGTALRPGYAPELDGHRQRAREARDWTAGLERTERERPGIKSLKVGYNKFFGYYLEIPPAALAGAERARAANGHTNGTVLPADYIPKQTLANATRYFTPQLKE